MKTPSARGVIISETIGKVVVKNLCILSELYHMHNFAENAPYYNNMGEYISRCYNVFYICYELQLTK